MRGIALALIAVLVAACSDSTPSTSEVTPGKAVEQAASGATPAPAAAKTVATAPAPRRREKPVPAFEGFSLDERRVSLQDYLGRRLVLFLFRPELREAPVVADALAGLQALRGDHNFAVLGVASGATDDVLRRFVSDHGLEFDVARDSVGSLGGRIGVDGVGVVVIDAEGYMVRGSNRFPTSGADPASQVEAELRGWLRLPAEDASAQAEFAARPQAPTFSADTYSDEGRFDFASVSGRPVVLMFFLHTCPHCHHALGFLKQELPKIPEESRPVLLGISIANRPTEVRAQLAEDDLDFFQLLFDGDEKIRTAYGATTGVPVVFWIDKAGRIAWRTDGWRDHRDPALGRMRLALLAGEGPPMLLHQTDYSGNEFCNTCHTSQHETWLLTTHATAYDTLVQHGSDRDPECVGCHVVGFGERGGFDPARPSAELEGVGCETCHGRGGPHQSPDHVVAGNYEPVCVQCHDSKHSLGFDYASFSNTVSHRANLLHTGLSVDEKRALLEERKKTRAALLPSQGDFVGSNACQSCHPVEHATWLDQPHAAAFRTLQAQEKGGEVACQRCHTTGFDKAGGFPSGGIPEDHPDRLGVGCESCHGPGGAHVADGSRKIGTILALGDKCDSCVILQICGACHDAENDAHFEFSVQEKIDRQRHGTIEAGTGKPLPDGEQAARTPTSAWVALLDHALEAEGP